MEEILWFIEVTYTNNQLHGDQKLTQFELYIL